MKINIEQEKLMRSNNASSIGGQLNNTKKEAKKKKKKNTIKDEDKQNTVLLNEKLNKSDSIKNDLLIKSETNNHKKLSGGKFYYFKILIVILINNFIVAGFFGTLFSLIKSAILVTICLGFICILIAVILPKYDSNLSDRITNYLQLQTELPVKKYHKLGIEKFAEIQKYLFVFLKKGQIYFQDIHKKYSASV